MIRRLVCWCFRRMVGPPNSSHWWIGRDEIGAFVNVTMIGGATVRKYFPVGEARKWGDTLVRAAYDHAEGIPFPGE